MVANLTREQWNKPNFLQEKAVEATKQKEEKREKTKPEEQESESSGIHKKRSQAKENIRATSVQVLPTLKYQCAPCR
jgi:ribosomal protein L9